MSSKVAVKQEKDGCWYVIDEKGVRYAQCGRWSTKELAQEEARIFMQKHGISGHTVEEIDARGTYEVYEEQCIANKLGIDKRRVRVESWYWGSEYIIYVDDVFLNYVENFWRGEY